MNKQFRIGRVTMPRHNPAPRIGMRKPSRRSQITGRAPSKRLVARRRRNARKGFFPNPPRRKAAVCIVQTANGAGGWDTRATYDPRKFADAKGKAISAAKVLARIEKVKVRVISR